MAGPPPGYPGAYPPATSYPQGYPPQPLGYTSYPPGYQYQNGMSPQQAAKARSLVKISNWLGWGGLAMLFIGSPLAGVAANSGVAAGIVAALAIIACIIGAVVGQVGRGMQGRVV
jgi:hypothetical protein